jgi:pimeloyl-ACP methyl ester carboxylesterase
MPKLRANGIELTYESFGEGEPLILIMGIGGQMIQWDEPFCRELASRGFRVIRFDNRDVGESDRVDHLGKPNALRILTQRVLGQKVEAPYTLNDMADDTAGLLDALQIGSAHVVGMSLGGMVAQCLALEHPGRVRSLCVIMSTPGELVLSAPAPKAYKALSYRPKKEGAEAAEEYQLQLFANVGAHPHRTPEQRIRELAREHYQRGVSGRGFARQFAAILASPGRLHRLHALRIPTVVIHGDADPLVRPIAGRLLASQIPGAELHVVASMGHDLSPSTWPFVVGRITDNARRTLTGREKPMGVARALSQRATRIH